MSYSKLAGVLSSRMALVAFLALIFLALVGCNTAPSTPATSPTPASATPTSRSAPTQATVVLPTLPVVVPTAATVPTTSTLTTPSPITTTTAPTATVARVVRTATATAAKPAVLSGRVAYSVVTDPGPRFHTIYVARVDGSGATKILDYAGWPAFSPTGKNIAFFQLPGGGKNEGLYISDDFGGNPVPVFISPGVCCIDWSRDGNWIVFTNSLKPKQPGGSILMVKVDGSYKTAVDLKVAGSGPAFSPDGKQIVFSGCLPGTNTCGLMATATDGSGGQRAITRDNGGDAHWAPRGDKIVYQASDNAGRNQVYVVNPDGSGKKQLTNGKNNDGQPTWSRDGGSILWRSDQNGTAWGIFAMNADGTNPRRILNNVPPDPNLWGWESLTVAP